MPILRILTVALFAFLTVPFVFGQSGSQNALNDSQQKFDRQMQQMREQQQQQQRENERRQEQEQQHQRELQNCEQAAQAQYDECRQSNPNGTCVIANCE